MTSLQIKGRVDGEQWESFIDASETVTESLQRLQQEHSSMCARDELLKAIDANADIALGKLLQSHKTLSQLVDQSAIALPKESIEATAPEKKTNNKLTAASKW